MQANAEPTMVGDTGLKNYGAHVAKNLLSLGKGVGHQFRQLHSRLFLLDGIDYSGSPFAPEEYPLLQQVELLAERK